MGQQQEIAGAYRIREGNRVEFALAKYDRNRELVIDPVLQYSTYLGLEGYDAGCRRGNRPKWGYSHHRSDELHAVSDDAKGAAEPGRRFRRVHREIQRSGSTRVDELSGWFEG